MENKALWYHMDNQSNVVNEGEGFEDREEAIADYKERWTREEAVEYGFTLCLLEEDGFCREELTVDDIF